MAAELQGGNEGFAFLVTLGAGLSTTIGAALAFCVPASSDRVTAIALGISAGVMVQISFLEIFSKSAELFQTAGWSEADAYSMATLVFFGGLLLVALLDAGGAALAWRWQRAAPPGGGELQPQPTTDLQGPSISGPDSVQLELPEAVEHYAVVAPGEALSAQKRPELMRTALFSGIAMAAHNFPEGAASFVSTAADPRFGPLLAIAVAIHNIPEGLSVALPILRATGSRYRAFWWAFLSGLSEPLGGLAAWLVLRNALTPLTLAVIFGLIGGIMIHVSVRKLLPLALKCDPQNHVASNSFFAGMAIMSASLVSFRYS